MPESLAALRLNVIHHHTPKALLAMRCKNRKEPLFPPGEPDDAWLEYVGKKKWIVFSHDEKFHKRETELSAIKQFDVGCFYLWGASAKNYEKARCFLLAYERILKAIAETPRPFIYKIDKQGKLSKIAIP